MMTSTAVDPSPILVCTIVGVSSPIPWIVWVVLTLLSKLLVTRVVDSSGLSIE